MLISLLYMEELVPNTIPIFNFHLKEHYLYLEPDQDPHQFADDRPKCTVWNISLFEHFFMGLNLYLEARIRIRIRIKVMRIRKTMVITYQLFVGNGGDRQPAGSPE